LYWGVLYAFISSKGDPECLHSEALSLWQSTILNKVCLPWVVSVAGNSGSSSKSFTTVLWQTWQSCWLANTSCSEPSVRSQLSRGQCENWYAPAELS